MPKFDFSNLSGEHLTSQLVLLALVALVGYLAPRIYDLWQEKQKKQKQITAMLVQLKTEIERAKSTSEMYCSIEFKNSMFTQIDIHESQSKAFRPFIPTVYREEKYQGWESLIIDLPRYILKDAQDYIANSRLIYALITRLQSEDFEKLSSDRKKAAIVGLIRINSGHVQTCISLAASLDHFELYGRWPWRDPNHLKTKRQ